MKIYYLFVLVAIVDSASICNTADCRNVNTQNEEAERKSSAEEESPTLDLESLWGIEVEPPAEEKDDKTLSLTRKIEAWPNATVPYAIWGTDETKEKVLNSLSKIEEETCVRFEPRDGQARYLLIKEGDGGCWTSSMGFPSTYEKVTINLGPGCKHGKQIKHEVYHALGFPHEQSRPDRTEHVTIKWDNIKDGASSQFSIKDNYPTLEVPYDLHSIMHYGRYDFAKDPTKPTIVPTPWVDGALGGDNLSYRDKRKVNVFYNCLEYLQEN